MNISKCKWLKLIYTNFVVGNLQLSAEKLQLPVPTILTHECWAKYSFLVSFNLLNV